MSKLVKKAIITVSQDKPSEKKMDLPPLVGSTINLFQSHLDKLVTQIASTHFEGTEESKKMLQQMMSESLSAQPMTGCVYILKKGKNKGSCCGAEIRENHFCSLHMEQILSEYYQKVVKALNKPKSTEKKPSSAYILFTKDERPKIKAEFPNMLFGDVGKELGNRWKALSEEAKLPYQKEAIRLKEEYKAKLGE